MRTRENGNIFIIFNIIDKEAGTGIMMIAGGGKDTRRGTLEYWTA